jgi:hypothetical protein
MLAFLVGLTLAVNLGPIAPDSPAREPQMAVRGSNVVLAFGAGNGIYVSTSADSGKTFSAPVKVGGGEVLPLTRHRGPRVALFGRAIIITAVVGKTMAAGPHAHGLPSDGDLIAWRSLDGGAHWSHGVVVNDSPGAPTEGLHSLAADAQGNLFAAWLDKRSGKGTKLFGAHSTDGGVTWSKNVMIYESPGGTICECCHPTVAFGSGGQLLAMFRNCLDGARDMYLTRSPDGISFSKPEKLGMESWQLNACPMDGGGLAVSGGEIVTAWRREHQIFLARPGEKEVGIGEGIDVAIAGTSSGVYVIWSGPAGVRVLAPGKKEPVVLSPQGTFPTIAAQPNGDALAAWEDGGAVHVENIDAVGRR